MKQDYRITNKNSTAVNILRSWLNAVNVPNEISTISEFDICVKGVTDVQVKVCISPEEVLSYGVNIMARDITGKNSKTALEAFYKVLDKAGYPRQNPLDRGSGPVLNANGNPLKLSYRNEDFLVAIRHTEFRRSPNPPPDRWAKYKNTMDAVSTSFYCLNRDLCIRHGIDRDDLLQYARCLMVNFCARYEIPNPVCFDNERKFYEYLRQRFNCDLVSILKKKERSVVPEAEVVQIAQFGEPYGELEVSPEEDSTMDFNYINRHCKLDLSSEVARKDSAAEELSKLLSKLPHNKMIEKLNSVIESNIDYCTKKEAKKRLDSHKANCSKCMDFRMEVVE